MKSGRIQPENSASTTQGFTRRKVIAAAAGLAMNQSLVVRRSPLATIIETNGERPKTNACPNKLRPAPDDPRGSESLRG